MAKTKLKCIFFLVAVSYVLSDRFVGGRRIGTMERQALVKHKGTLKTIVGKDGDFIDCVDINQQPAFDHPLLKNHTIQMEPDSILKVTNGEFYDTELLQGLLENGECPEGTIPIRHAQENEYYYAHRSMPSVESLDSNISGHEYTGVNLFGGNYSGAHAFINVWNPAIADGDISIAEIALSSNHSNITSSIHAGWIVNSQYKEPKLFIYWRRDESTTTGCYNLKCPGFVQVNQRIVLGSSLKPVSSYQGRQYSIEISIYKNMGNWWLQVHDQVLGYWPTSIFTDLANIGATAIYWGGAIHHNSRQQGNHTTTQMGSGHFPNEGFGKASYFRNIQYMDGLGKFNDTDQRQLVLSAKTPFCYGISVDNSTNEGFGTHFYFGGPGCP